MKKDEHSKFHSANAFCGYAGPEEMQHLQDLISKLTDKELETLVEKVGITYEGPFGSKPDRDELEDVVDEADREDFYREYKKIINSRKIKKT